MKKRLLILTLLITSLSISYLIPCESMPREVCINCCTSDRIICTEKADAKYYNQINDVCPYDFSEALCITTAAAERGLDKSLCDSDEIRCNQNCTSE